MKLSKPQTLIKSHNIPMHLLNDSYSSQAWVIRWAGKGQPDYVVTELCILYNCTYIYDFLLHVPKHFYRNILWAAWKNVFPFCSTFLARYVFFLIRIEHKNGIAWLHFYHDFYLVKHSKILMFTTNIRIKIYLLTWINNMIFFKSAMQRMFRTPWPLFMT